MVLPNLKLSKDSKIDCVSRMHRWSKHVLCANSGKLQFLGGVVKNGHGLLDYKTVKSAIL